MYENDKIEGKVGYFKAILYLKVKDSVEGKRLSCRSIATSAARN